VLIPNELTRIDFTGTNLNTIDLRNFDLSIGDHCCGTIFPCFSSV